MQNQRIYGLSILAGALFGSTFLFINPGLNTGASPLFLLRFDLQRPAV